MTETMKRALREAANADDAVFLQRFFKTGEGKYGVGDRFLGVRVPATRQLVKQFGGATLEDMLELLESEWHEERLLALLLMVRLYQRGDEDTQRQLYENYLANTAHINNWDLVDSSAEHIVGAFLYGKANAQRVLMRLGRSTQLWERRIAMLSTFHFIKRGEIGIALAIAEHLLNDTEDLIHKAVGWMLREVGKRDHAALERFLEPRILLMPRTMLRYAIEKFPEPQRQRYLKQKTL